VVDRRPDLVLCDWAMNLFGGNEFLHVLRKDRDPVVSTTPVLVVTAHASRKTILEAVGIGIHGFVAKPIAPAILYRHINEILDRQEIHGRSKGIAEPGQERPFRRLDASGLPPMVAPAAAENALALL
jgi:two-component system chemotaxis response regulator CheY